VSHATADPGHATASFEDGSVTATDRRFPRR
jgi:hypothetical protein